MSNQAVLPTSAQMEKMASTGPDGPVVMVNLLKYRDRAAYEPHRAEAKEELSGREAYLRYGATASRCVAERGGAIVWMGSQAFVLIGGPEQDWDDVVCVKYPSRRIFLDMISSPEYLAVAYHRDAALERTALLCCSAGSAS
jgi:uncharacterized protein (DUF1330 family)